MKKMNKKGFTIVELVIVIAVIAILAGVMIPTFGGIIKTANESNVKSAAAATFKDLYGVDLSDGAVDKSTESVDCDPDVTKAIAEMYTSADIAVSYKASADGKTITFEYTDVKKAITVKTTDNCANWTVSAYVAPVEP